MERKDLIAAIQNTCRELTPNLQNNKLTFQSVVKLINNKKYSILVTDISNNDIMAHTFPEDKKVVVNLNNLKNQEKNSSLSLFILLHEYFHILENLWAPLIKPKTKNKKQEQADVFAKIILEVFDENAPEGYCE